MRGGMGNMGNMQQMMKQAQQMQEKMLKAQEDLKDKTVEAAVGGGAVVVVANGANQIISVKIEKELVTSGDTEMLQDLLLAAVNEALNKAKEMNEIEMKKITGGIGMPGLF
ncbi:MAG: YbaB/EbfC family nucleoid-associated protein [bacterium]